ncbi:MAG: RsiV family protein [Oscillospiraceae bacterium]|nr:RsiV family protein [Oscillospiraceae bacterium]
MKNTIKKMLAIVMLIAVFATCGMVSTQARTQRKAPVRKSTHSSYKVSTSNPNILSVRFDTEVSQADTSHTVRIYNFDKKTGNQLSLKDMFKKKANYKPVLNKEVRRQMNQRKKKNPNKSYFPEEVAVSDATSFYVNPKGNLVLVFDKGTVAPMSTGLCEFTIPQSAIKNIANPRYF